MNNVILQVVRKDLCSGCGVCVGICPGQVLSMTEAPNGDLTSRWTKAPCTANCGLCLTVCPFAEGVLNPRPLNQEAFGPQQDRLDQHFHEDTGYYDRAFVGYAEANRDASASGGLLTWTLESLLVAGEVDRVAVVVCEPEHVQGYRFVFEESQTIQEVRRGAGSVYHQVEISEILQHIAREPALRWAVTGVPCLCAALRQAMHRMPKLGSSICYLLGLACGMYQNRFYTEMLLAESGVDPRNTVNIEYRRKSDGGSPSDYRFCGTDNRGQGKEIAYHGLPYYLGRNSFFRVNACNFCRDVFAETADACFMDAWLPEYQKEPRGTSLVLVRNQVIRQMLEQGEAENSVFLDEIGIEKVVASQKGHVRRKRQLIVLRQGKAIDPSSGSAFTISDRLAWLVQRYAQRRSKDAWATIGRNKGVQAFWRATWDVSLLIHLEAIYNKTLGRVLRLLARIKR